MWTRAEEGRSRKRYLAVMQDCEDYAGYSDEHITKLINSGAVMWYWEGMGFELALSYRIRDGKAKIVNGVPSRAGTGENWCKTMIAKIREEMDNLGIQKFYAKQLDRYKSDHMKEFAEYIDRVCWEVKEQA